MFTWSCVKSSRLSAASISPQYHRVITTVSHTDCLAMILNYVERVVSQRTSLSSKWIQFQSCARCKMHTLKQASTAPHTHKHTQFLSHPIAIYLLVYCTRTFFFFFCPFAHFCSSFLLPQADYEWHVIMTCNEIKEAFTTQPWQTGWQDGRRKTRKRDISTSTLLSLPAGSILALAQLHLLCVMTWQREGK